MRTTARSRAARGIAFVGVTSLMIFGALTVANATPGDEEPAGQLLTVDSRGYDDENKDHDGCASAQTSDWLLVE